MAAPSSRLSWISWQNIFVRPAHNLPQSIEKRSQIRGLFSFFQLLLLFPHDHCGSVDIEAWTDQPAKAAPCRRKRRDKPTLDEAR